MFRPKRIGMAATAVVGAGLILRRGVDAAVRGRPGLAPLSRALTRNGPFPYAEQWSLSLGSFCQGWHFLLDLILCNPSDLSYEVETTAAYVSLCFCDGSGGWQLLDRYSLRHFHVSLERGEILVGTKENPRCSLRLVPEKEDYRLSISGCMERRSFLRRGFSHIDQDVSWDLRIHFLEARYPDALLDLFPRWRRIIQPCGVSLLCLPSRVCGMFKVNGVVYDPEVSGKPYHCWLLQRWGDSFPSSEQEILCLGTENSGERASALRLSFFPQEGGGRSLSGHSGISSFFFLREGRKTHFLRNTPLEHGKLQLLSWEREAERPHPSNSPLRLDLSSRFRATRATARVIHPLRLDALLPGTHGQCIIRSWHPLSQLTVERKGLSSSFDVEMIIESGCGGWWDRVADFMEIPADLGLP